MVELSPLWRSALVLLLLRVYYFIIFGCARLEWHPELRDFSILRVRVRNMHTRK